MKNSFTLHRLVIPFYVLACYLILSIVLAFLGKEISVAIPGDFLFSRFHFASFYLPGLLIIGGRWLNKPSLPHRSLLLMWFSPLPFLTLALFLQVFSGNTDALASWALLSSLGRFPSLFLLFFLLAFELLGMKKIALINQEEKPPTGFFPSLWSGFPLSIFPAHKPVPTAPESSQDEVEQEEKPLIPFPSFPEIPSQPLPVDSPNGDEARESNLAALERRSFVDSEEDFPSSEDKESVETVHPVNTHKEKTFFSLENPVSPSSIQENSFDTSKPSFIIPAPTEEKDSVLSLGESPAVDRSSLEENAPRKILSLSQEGMSSTSDYALPIANILQDYPDSDFSSIDEDTRDAATVLERTLKEFKIDAKVTGIRKGPVITMFELLPSPGVKISRIVSLLDNIALRLAASRVRIVAPIPGKHAVGIEVPNKKRAIVSFRSLVDSEEFQQSDAHIPIILGQDISGEGQVVDLTKTPHLLIAGATGSGKSVCVNSLIGSILYARSPQEVKMIMVDPKIVELKLYNDIPHLLAPVITEPKRAIQSLQWCLYEMERRYSLLDTQGVRDLRAYNKRIKERRLATEALPYIVVLVDEFADLMATSGKELEGIVARLAAMSRAVGIHLVLATQRPSVDVITGLIKANFPSRIAFMVAGKTDSRIIIDAVGAEKLLGRGDMLFTSAWDPFPSRVQGAFLAEEEVERLANYVKTLGEPEYIEEEMFFDEEEEEESLQVESRDAQDPLLEKALELIAITGKTSASFIQRRLKVGYNRAARLVEEMERRGIVGPANGSKPRDLIHIPERFKIGREINPREEVKSSSA